MPPGDDGVAPDGRRSDQPASAPLAPGVVSGVGLGGFVDGIVLHQLLQWHHMLSATDRYPPDTLRGLEVNTLADGLFHVGAWLAIAAGSWLTVAAWRAGRLAPPWRAHLGALLVGWGLFNVIEGIVNHHVLRVHHVRDDVASPLAWDLGFLAVGVALVAGGAALISSGRRSAMTRTGAGSIGD